MAVASNPLLQIASAVSSAGKAQSTSVSGLSKTADATKDGGSSFAAVYAQEHKALPQKHAAGTTARVTSHLAASDKKPAVASQTKDDKPSVTAGDKHSSIGKGDKSDKAGKAAKADATNDRDSVKAKDDDDAKVVDDSAIEDKDPASQDDPDASLATAAPTDATPVAQPADPVPVALEPTQQPQPAVDPAQLQAVAQAPAASANDAFDPAADPLADLPMVRMALEQSAKDQGTTSVHAKAETAEAQVATDPAVDASFAESMGAALEQQKVTDGGMGDSDSEGLGAIGELAGSAAEGRVDDMSSRLSQLNQAVAGKGASAAAPTAQPLNMQQSGWSEGLVNRVMYLSSQNLKSAEIQLHPLELGRLDIRVDVTPDQQTQITFHSAHLGVRDALDSQQNRLRDMLAQQGMTQVDVNVSDQSRQSQQQQHQHAQASQGSGSGTQGRAGTAGDESDDISAVAAAAANQTVIGSSLVDYYA